MALAVALLAGCVFDTQGGSGVLSPPERGGGQERGSGQERGPGAEASSLPVDGWTRDFSPVDGWTRDLSPQSDQGGTDSGPTRDASVVPPDRPLVPPDLPLVPDTPSCPPNQFPCATGCKDLSTDPSNCGVCGKLCAADETCVAGACAPLVGCAAGSNDQVFSLMRGCKGKVGFSQRATLCESGFHVCTAAEWVDRRAGVVPTYSYWTNDFLYASKDDSIVSCAAYLMKPKKPWCDGTHPPMRVCAGKLDLLGNSCNWTGCGYLTISPSQYFGGCEGNNTAGALCCL